MVNSAPEDKPWVGFPASNDRILSIPSGSDLPVSLDDSERQQSYHDPTPVILGEQVPALIVEQFSVVQENNKQLQPDGCTISTTEIGTRSYKSHDSINAEWNLPLGQLGSETISPSSENGSFSEASSQR